MSQVVIVQANYNDPVHAQALRDVLNHYAQDPMGGGEALSAQVLEQLPGELAKRAHAFSVLLVNVHDVSVVDTYRGLGLSQKMLDKVEAIARERGCCKITLEVLEGNPVAQGSYRKFGFSAGQLDPAHGRMLFWNKPL